MDTSSVLSRYYDCLAARDTAGLRALLADDIVVTYYAQPDQLPWAGTFHGHDGFDTFLGLVSEHVSIVDAKRLEPIISEHHAVVRTTGVWKAHASGRLIEGGMINVFAMSDSKITSYEVWADTAAFVTGLAN